MVIFNSYVSHYQRVYMITATVLLPFPGPPTPGWSSLVRPASLRTMRAFAREPLELGTFTRFLAVGTLG